MTKKIVLPSDRRLGFWPSVFMASLLVLCGYLAYQLLTEKSKSPPPPPQTVAVQNPDEATLRCEQGKWVTQVGSWREDSTARSVFSTLRLVQERAEKNGMKLRLNYTSPDKNQCSIVDRNVYFLWTGPYANGKAAIQICNKLGWKTARDSTTAMGGLLTRTIRARSEFDPTECPGRRAGP
jgi:hypothetical protein